jgi:PBP1b-binding outer membrane lipoprotein LpoB
MSKRSSLISLLIILVSSCTQQVTTATPPPEKVQSTHPVSSNTLESVSASPITLSPDLAAT